MRTLFYLFIIFLFYPLFSCQSTANGQIPEVVKRSFESKYPGENDPDWHEDKNGNFESNFKKDGDKYRADFSPQGAWIETERSIKKKDLPKEVQKKPKDEYSTFKVLEIEEVDHYLKGLSYDVELKKGGEKHEVEFSANGQVLI